MKNICNFVLLFFATIVLVFVPISSQALDISSLDSLFYSDTSFSGKTKTISMDFQNARLNDVLKILSQQSGVNFISASDAADKTFSLYLDNVSVDEALNQILTANNLTYELNSENNIFIVKNFENVATLITRVYPLKHATVSSSKINTTFLLQGGGSSGGNLLGAGGLRAGSSGASKLGIKGAIEALLTEEGSITEDKRTNSLIITDIESRFPMIEQTIARLDIKVPQILIEVEMLDISKDTADLLGAKFGDTPITFQGAQKDSIFPFNVDNALEDGNLASFAGSQYRLSTLSFEGLQFTLQFLRTKTDTRNLARPRILTLNNETAEIQIKTDEAIGLASNTTSSEGTASTVATAERVETGVFLKVTPQANIKTREITMAIEPRVVQARAGQTFSGNTFRDPEERGTKSHLRIRDGDTIIIGGLLRTDISNIKTKVPILNRIPVLGAAFRHKDLKETERELIIFITPHILREELAGNLYPRKKNIVREQSHSLQKMQAVDQALSLMESQR